MQSENRPAPGPDAGLLPITAYVRTLNEEKMIGDVVGAAARLCDEVVVIDCGSKDATAARAEAAGARVIVHEWLGNGHQKRLAEEAARNDWLLDLDADEILSDALCAEIRALFAGGAPAPDIFQLKLVIVTPFGDVWSWFGLDHRAKLYNRRLARMPADAISDQLDGALRKGRRKLRGALYHHAFRDMRHLAERMNSRSSRGAPGAARRGMAVTLLRIAFGLPVYFLKKYLVSGYVFGGAYGFSAALVLAYGRWLRDVKAYEILRGRQRSG
ncbi:MAG: glycosyltransferase family 2 protein [Hyphomicrobiaceae bacterium]|nr:glycosyltransferase family 2 protein [Hyphomicrobiaceae bacterium]